MYVNVRVLAATNENLEERIKDGGFREDLFYRLNVITVDLPSLRERMEDIPLLVSHFLKAKSAENGISIPSVSKRALDVIRKHGWPGNVRELENAIERACALCDEGLIKVDDLPVQLHALADESVSDTEAGLAPNPDTTFAEKDVKDIGEKAPGEIGGLNKPVGQLKDWIREQEQVYLQRAIAQTGGDKDQAAKMLGINQRFTESCPRLKTRRAEPRDFTGLCIELRGPVQNAE